MSLQRSAGLFLVLCLSGSMAQGGAGHAVKVTATILPRLELRELRHPRELVVTEQDVVRGFVESDATTQVSVSSNCPFRILLRITGDEVESADAAFRGQALGAAGGVFPPSRNGEISSVRYRFKLRPSVRPGTFAWPAQLVFEPAAT
jgi:hypothetical protein